MGHVRKKKHVSVSRTERNVSSSRGFGVGGWGGLRGRYWGTRHFFICNVGSLFGKRRSKSGVVDAYIRALLFFFFLFFLVGHSFIYSHKKLDYNIKKNIDNNIAPPRLMGERGRKKRTPFRFEGGKGGHRVLRIDLLCCVEMYISACIIDSHSKKPSGPKWIHSYIPTLQGVKPSKLQPRDKGRRKSMMGR